MNEFPVAFKQHRQEAGLSQRAAAEMLGVRKQAVQQWEARRTTPSVSHYPQIATMMGVDVEDLTRMFGEGDDSNEVRARLDALDRRNEVLSEQIDALRQQLARLVEVVELALDGGDDQPEDGDPRLDG